VRKVSWLCFLVAAMLAPAVLNAQASAQAPAQSTAPKPATTTHTATHTTATHAATDPALLNPALLKAKAPEVYEVTFVTTKGTFVVQVTRAWAPQGADRFYNLVRHRFYNDMALFRVVPGFVVQFGLGPSPAVNKVWETARIKDDPVTQTNAQGTITFATAGPNTRTTQVFINLGNNGALDGQGFAPFGKVTSGMDVIQNFYNGYADNTTNDQGNIMSGGKAYLLKTYPKLDTITTATVTSPAPAAPVKKPAATAPAKKPAAAPQQ
jgi:peptidyl-prolyl cis-trans isomerase A (cyclophilin A)